jgi:hypothetical protein
MAKVTVTKTYIVPKNKLRYEYADQIEEGTPVNAVLEAIRNKRIENLQAGKFTLTKTMVDDESDSTKVRIQTITIWNNDADHQTFVNWLNATYPDYVTTRNAWEEANGIIRTLNVVTE